jgi:hypothetical protein
MTLSGSTEHESDVQRRALTVVIYNSGRNRMGFRVSIAARNLRTAPAAAVLGFGLVAAVAAGAPVAAAAGVSVGSRRSHVAASLSARSNWVRHLRTAECAAHAYGRRHGTQSTRHHTRRRDRSVQ